ncbi:unnamed protein product, partial [Staurois parvus]
KTIYLFLLGYTYTYILYILLYYNNQWFQCRSSFYWMPFSNKGGMNNSYSSVVLECHLRPGADWPFGNSGTAGGPGSVGGPMSGFFIGFFGCGRKHRGPMIPYCPGAP